MSFSIPWESLFGGVLLGISASVLLLMNGKIAGISGIVSGLLTPKRKDYSWRLLFFIGMMLGGMLAGVMFNVSIPGEFSASPWLLAVSGLLVGIGTKIGNGCTSGHGICGIGRFSFRSIVATLTFMLVAALTVFFRLHVI
ncbi:YeeE/YedE thiosulfate transporter family protein [Vibrio sp. TH_r3]|uniref:YeeE/YedE family protein n=1 Tax=Vibrio sp. TH_r3 TaxID=3082084 RepID=UPI002954ACB6|nr:YeeE/YedE thiosulfate transporter family protein [Vibrio sp. TH_r3]MDV7103540.1 YeeE/YedE thiosulfate transporter family protein [Vibrio sp. TH_r3]